MVNKARLFGVFSGCIVYSLMLHSAHAGVSLETVVNWVITRNERSTIAELRTESAHAALDRARTGYLPSVVFSANDTLRPYPVTGSTAQHSFSASLTVTQPIINPTTILNYRSAKYDLQSAKQQTVEEKRILTFDAARAFFATLTQEQFLKAAERRLAFAKASLANANARFDAQLNGSNDVTRSTLEMATANREVTTAQGGIQRAYLQLSFLVKNNIQGDLELPVATLAMANATPGHANQLVAQAIKRRPDLAGANYRILSLETQAIEPKWRFAPTLSLQGQTRGGTERGALLGNFDTTISLNLSWPIWDAGLRQADRRSRLANVFSVKSETDLLVRRISLEVQSALVSLQAAQATYKIAESAVAVAARSADETATLYRQGLARAIELIDANGRKFDAEIALANAQLAVAQAFLDLRAATGLDALGREVKP